MIIMEIYMDRNIKRDPYIITFNNMIRQNWGSPNQTKQGKWFSDDHIIIKIYIRWIMDDELGKKNFTEFRWEAIACRERDEIGTCIANALLAVIRKKWHFKEALWLCKLMDVRGGSC